MTVERGPVNVNHLFNYHSTGVASDVVGLIFLYLKYLYEEKNHHLFFFFKPSPFIESATNRCHFPMERTVGRAGCSSSINIREHSVLAWRIPGTGEPGGLPSMGSHRVGHD